MLRLPPAKSAPSLLMLLLMFGTSVASLGCEAVLGLEDTTAGVADASHVQDSSITPDGATKDGATKDSADANTDSSQPSDAGHDVSADGPSGDSSGDSGCDSSSKLCGGMCVSRFDPAYGCTPDSCTPCAANNVKTFGCLANKCVVTECSPKYADCDKDPSNGCESTAATDSKNCGSCGNDCAATLLHVNSPSCQDGVCHYASCVAGFDNCDADDSNGCETNIWSLTHCGSCTAGKCSVNNGTPSCAGGTCHVNSCASGWETCDKDCDTHTADDIHNCGACGNDCSKQMKNAETDCVSGKCQLIKCVNGALNCDKDDANGCEIPANSVDNCGTCGRACSSKHTTSRSCFGGLCVPHCAAAWGDCNNASQAPPNDGCETPVNTLENCGHCGLKCGSHDGTTVACVSEHGFYTCQYTCASSHSDCNGDGTGRDTDGCECLGTCSGTKCNQY